jgi:hypothetical protein
MSACPEYSASNLWPLGPGCRCSPYPPTLVYPPWLWIELIVVGLRVFWSCDQGSAICLSSWHSGIWTVKLFIEFVVVPPPIGTIFYFRAPYRSEKLSLKYEQLVLLPFGQHPRFTAVKQEMKGSTADVCAVRRSTYLRSGFFVVFPDSRHSLVSSGILGTQIIWLLQSAVQRVGLLLSYLIGTQPGKAERLR